jgi:hypothetical protein
MEEMSAMWEEKKLGRDHGARISLQRTKAALGPWRATARDSLLLAVLVYVLANMAFKGYTHLTASPSVGVIRAASIDSCPGYAVSNVVQSRGSITADLSLAGPACNVYGTDLDQLKLLVEYQTGKSRRLVTATWWPGANAIQTVVFMSKSTMQPDRSTKCPPRC